MAIQLINTVLEEEDIHREGLFHNIISTIIVFFKEKYWLLIIPSGSSCIGVFFIFI